METSGTEKQKLLIEGMDCANCALGISRTLTKKGDCDVHVDFTTGEASFILAPHRQLEEAIKDIEKLGYRIVRSEQSGVARFTITLQQKFWFSAILTLPLIIGHVIPNVAFIDSPYVQLVLGTPVFILGFLHFGKSAYGSLRSGVPNMDVLIVTGIIAAYAYSLAGTLMFWGTHEAHRYMFFETAASITTLVLLGNLIEHRSVKQTTSAIDELAALMPEKARRIITIGSSEREELISPDLLHVSDVVQVNAGESFAADGIVISGSGQVNEAMISGESLPSGKITGSEILAGTVLLDGPIRFKVTRTGSQNTLARIIELVKSAQREKPPIQRLADRISAWFVPIVIGISLITFGIEFWILNFALRDSIMNAVAVLVISCPCAMGLATPTAVMVGVGRAAKAGILVRSGAVLEILQQVQYAVFDKTGTLTTGKFSAVQINAEPGFQKDEIESALLGLELQSAHPLAHSLVEILKGKSAMNLSNVSETKGVGISGTDMSGNIWEAGSWRIFPEGNKQHDIYILKNGVLAGYADLKDEIKPGSAEVIQLMKSQGIKVVLLSGDRKQKCEEVARTLGIDEIHAEQLPEDKLNFITKLSAENKTLMIGDGINDAPALAKATVGMALSDATKAAISTAQIIVPGSTSMQPVADALLIGKHTLKTIRQNLFWAFFYNVIAIPLAAAGFLSPMISALSMAFSDVIVIGNSLLLRTKKLR
ncbi:MAG: cadmium-translocating P-type ATPase [Bacteroidia bacterium]|nr:cadmium-translocating P-type ATPase [Bacteroidia bacterium]